MPAVLVDGVAHTLEVLVEHARQDGRLQPLAQRRIADEIGEECGHHLALGGGLGAPPHAIGDEPLHHAGRRQPGARLLKMLEVGSRRFELRSQAFVPSPLAIERGNDYRQEHQRNGY